MRINNRTPIFLKVYEATGSVKIACEAVKISRTLHYQRLKKDPAYATAFEQATKRIQDFRTAEALQRARELEAKVQELEDAVWDRALNGIEEPTLYQGEFTYSLYRDEKGRIRRSTKPTTVRKYEHAREAFLLRGAKPEKYRERFTHSGSIDVNVARFKGSLEDLLIMHRELTQEEEE